MERIGFIGAGLMGHGMAANLLKAGHPLTLLANRNRKPIDDLLARGAREAASAEALARATDIIILCVDRAETVEAVVARLEPGLRSGQFVIDATTSLPDVSRRLYARLEARGVTFVDAPVVGAPKHAEAGEIGTLVGAEDAVFKRLEPVFLRYCSQAIRFGPVGAGHTGKLLNNFVTQGTAALLTQAYRAARRNNVDWDSLYRTMLKGAARSGSLEKYIGPAVAGDYRGYEFALANALKDVTYAGTLISADKDGAAIQAAVAGQLARAVRAGFGERFVSEQLDPAVEARLLEEP